MLQFTQWLNQVSVCLEWEIPKDFNGPVVAALKFLELRPEQIPEWRPREMAIINFINFELCFRVTKAELLIEIDTLIDVFRHLLPNVLLTAIDLTRNSGAQMNLKPSL